NKRIDERARGLIVALHSCAPLGDVEVLANRYGRLKHPLTAAAVDDEHGAIGIGYDLLQTVQAPAAAEGTVDAVDADDLPAALAGGANVARSRNETVNAARQRVVINASGLRAKIGLQGHVDWSCGQRQ